MVLAFRSPSEQLLQGLSCDQRFQASATSLTLHGRLLDVLEPQEAAETAQRVLESVPRSTPRCSTGRV